MAEVGERLAPLPRQGQKPRHIKMRFQMVGQRMPRLDGAAKVASPSITVQPRASAALRHTCNGAVKLVGSCFVASPRHTPYSS